MSVDAEHLVAALMRTDLLALDQVGLQEHAVALQSVVCRRHHVLWHRGTLGLHDLHTPWLPDPENTTHNPWDQHNPPLVA